ncbi:MAG: GH3 auxin-responsive promoter family protein [Bacteroidales bacterium]|nr:GH3 auxin-responsive promoter family protein [Bacteroidales bacterium]
MVLTKLASYIFADRIKEIERFKDNAEIIQKKQLQKLLSTAKKTEWGKMYGYADGLTPHAYAERVPARGYEQLRPYIDRLLAGESNLTWPGSFNWFSQSSGTTDDKSKFIPVSNDTFNKVHYRGGVDSVAIYLHLNPESDFFSGKGLILGGTHSPSKVNNKVHCGDLSGLLIDNANPLLNLIRVPDKKVVLMNDWGKKLQKIMELTVSEDITNLSGIPSWFLLLGKKILQYTGKSNLLEVWPNLEVFFHGGISFAPYREQFKALLPSDNMHYIETYNASEGFFAVQNDFSDPGMLLMIDYGIYYEFIPLEEVDCEFPKAVPLWEVELGKTYAMVISTNSGLWRYIIGDTVQFTSLSPHKIILTGRTKHFINICGEELMVGNTDRGIEMACNKTGARVREYTVGPVFMTEKQKARHHWIIEFEKAPDDMELFNETLDKALQSLNSDYEAKRKNDITFDRLTITVGREGLFYDWMKQNGKLGGQHKVPRLSNQTRFVEELMKLNQ